MPSWGGIAVKMLSRQNARRAARRMGRAMSHGLRLVLALMLSGILPAAAAFAAEIVAVEMVASVPNAVIVVPQGGSATFEVQVSATGNLNEAYTEANPATARVATSFEVAAGALAVTGRSDPLPFWSKGEKTDKSVLWTGYPAPYVLQATVTVPSGTPVGDYSGVITMLLTNPSDVAPKLTNDVLDRLTVRVVAGDATPPTTTATVSGAAGDNGWYTSSVLVTLSATDNPGGSGVLRTEWSTDGGAHWTAGTTIPLLDEGTHSVWYRSVDVAGNTEPIRTLAVRIDLTDPEIAVTGVADGTCAREVDIAVSACDAAAGSGIRQVTATLDGDAFSGGAVDAEGDHVLAVTAVDQAGRTSARSVAFTIDRTGPEIVIASPADGAAYREAPAFEYTVSDAEGIARCDSSHPLGHVFAEQGEHSVWVEAEDRAGNAARASATFIVDYEAPVTEATLDGTVGENQWFTSAVHVTLDATDPSVDGATPSGVAETLYRIDGGPWTPYDGEFVIDAEGEHQLEYCSTDRAGNAEEVREATVKIDTTSPEASITLDGVRGKAGSGWWVSPVTAALGGSDSVSGFARAEFSYDGSVWAPATEPLLFEEGVHELYARAYDWAGNVSAVAHETIRVDTLAPATACSLDGDAGRNGWFLGPVQVTLAAEDAGSGVDATEYSFDAETWTPYTGPFTVADPGVTTVHYRSADAAGNQEAASTAVIMIDLGDPLIAIEGVTDGDWVRSATVAYGATDPDPGSGIAEVSATLDGEPFASGSTVEAEGYPHVLVVTATDVAGRTSTRRVEFTVDRTAPEIVIESPEDGGAYDSDVELRFSVTDRDPEMRVESSHENGFVFTDEGAYRVDISAEDRASNRSERSVEFMIDLTAPTVDCQLSGTLGSNGWWTSAVTAYLVPDDPVSNGVASNLVRTYWRLDGGAWNEGTEVEIADEGVHTLEFYGRDRAGNASPVESRTVSIDLTDPAIDVRSPESRTYLFGETVVLDFSASDAVSGIAGTLALLNGVEVRPGEAIRLTQPGTNVLVVTATDAAGRTAERRVEFRVAFVPGVMLPPGSLDHTWNAGRMMPVKFTVLDAFGKPTDQAKPVVEVRQNGMLLCAGEAIVQYDCRGLPYYQFNAKTLKNMPGTLTVLVTLNDGGTTMTQTIYLR